MTQPPAPHSTRTPLVILIVVLVFVAGSAVLFAQLRRTPEGTANTNRTTGANTAVNENRATNLTSNANTSSNTNSSGSAFTDWKAYSFQNKFTFRYPPNWQVVSLGDSKAGVALRSPDYSPIRDGDVTLKGEIYVNSLNNPQNLSPEELFSTFDDTSRLWFSKFPYEAHQFGSNSATYFRSFEDNGPTRSTILIQGQGLIAELDYLYNNDSARDVLETIASTVSFPK